MGSTFFAIASVVTLGLTSSGANASTPPKEGRPDLNPVTFFLGRTHGSGSLDTLINSPVAVTVDSIGYVRGNELVLRQTVRKGSKPASTRQWTMRKVTPYRYAGTLTDATGPVLIIVDGNRAKISYSIKGGLSVKQLLAVQPDGKTMLNVLKVKKLGLRVAVLRETIRKTD